MLTEDYHFYVTQNIDDWIMNNLLAKNRWDATNIFLVLLIFMFEIIVYFSI